MKKIINQRSSFRDPSGSLFYNQNQLYRSINFNYRENYYHLMKSGLYNKLLNQNLIVKHVEVKNRFNPGAFKIIKPEIIKFISYPYEWSFSETKDVALQALKIQSIALDYGMSLKDASAYNFQFKDLNPVLIDTLSFEKYSPGDFWESYKQFCQHFLAPLTLMAYVDNNLNLLLKHYLDGIPLDLTSKLLPFSTYFNLTCLFNIHLHSKSQNFTNKKLEIESIDKLSRKKPSIESLRILINSLKKFISHLEEKDQISFWKKYYDDNSYTKKSFLLKKNIVRNILKKIPKKNIVWDLGSNTGIFSFIATELGFETIAMDYDSRCIDKTYLIAKEKKSSNLLPIVIDLNNPSANIGWENNERESLFNRGPADIVISLALIHHLIISNNVPINRLPSFYKKITKKYLIIEFVPVDDIQVKGLLTLRRSFHNYSQNDFEKVFKKEFKIIQKFPIQNKGRVIYFMEKK